MVHPSHWSYYISLEDDLIEASRYVEICEDNLNTYSVQFTRLLLATCSEVDVVAKTLCKEIDPSGDCDNIDDYRRLITPSFPAIPNVVFGIQWNEIRVKPWESWADARLQSPANPPPQSPQWWRDHNAVKHQRSLSFKQANLRNVIESLAGLHCLIRHLAADRGQPKLTRFLRIHS